MTKSPSATSRGIWAACDGATRCPRGGSDPADVITIHWSPVFRSSRNGPVYVAPGSSVIRSPGCASSSAVCRLPPAFTWMTRPRPASGGNSTRARGRSGCTCWYCAAATLRPASSWGTPMSSSAKAASRMGRALNRMSLCPALRPARRPRRQQPVREADVRRAEEWFDEALRIPACPGKRSSPAGLGDETLRHVERVATADRKSADQHAVAAGVDARDRFRCEQHADPGLSRGTGDGPGEIPAGNRRDVDGLAENVLENLPAARPLGHHVAKRKRAEANRMRGGMAANDVTAFGECADLVASQEAALPDEVGR